jgi:hypothetical protein
MLIHHHFINFWSLKIVTSTLKTKKKLDLLQKNKTPTNENNEKYLKIKENNWNPTKHN